MTSAVNSVSKRSFIWRLMLKFPWFPYVLFFLVFNISGNWVACVEWGCCPRWCTGNIQNIRHHLIPRDIQSHTYTIAAGLCLLSDDINCWYHTQSSSVQVVHTHLPRSPSSGTIIWHQRKVGSKQAHRVTHCMAPCPWSCSFGWSLAENHRIGDQCHPSYWATLYSFIHSFIYYYTARVAHTTIHLS